MAGRGGGAARKTLLAPIHFIFSLLQKRNTVSIWLYENLHSRIEGKIRVGLSFCIQITRLTLRQGFDEFMNLVVDDAVEVELATKDKAEKRRQLGTIRHNLKSANSLMQAQDKYY
jgi:small nuclear ribonucleoprotein E